MKNSLKWLTIIFLKGSFFSATAQTPVDPALAAALQTRIDSFVVHNTLPGISVTLLLPGNRYWNGASGLSDIYLNIPMDTSHLFHLASMNKMYVAAMAFQLIEQGLLSLNDTIGMFLPPLNNVPPGTTIENLLKHRSGIADILAFPGVFDEWFYRPDSIWPHELTINTFVAPPNFVQGQSFEYSNTNYVLLGMIIEHITGNTFADELKNRFLIPYGMTQTFFEPDDSVAGPYTPGWTSFTTPNVYNTNASAILNDCSSTMCFTAGAMVAKPAEVARFTRLLWSGQIVSSASLNTMKQCTNVVFGGGCNGYGYGTMRYVFGGKTYYGHAGDVNGFTQLTIHHQEDSVTLTISVNRNGAPRGPMAYEILFLLNQFITSIHDQSIERSFSVFPNPASDEIHIRFDEISSMQRTYKILDLSGKIVKSKTVSSSHDIVVDVSDLVAGTYFICMNQGNEESNSRFVIAE